MCPAQSRLGYQKWRAHAPHVTPAGVPSVDRASIVHGAGGHLDELARSTLETPAGVYREHGRAVSGTLGSSTRGRLWRPHITCVQ